MTQLPGSRSVEGDLERRIALALLLVLVVWLLLLARLFYLQVVEGDRHRVSAQRNSVRTHRVQATRGIVLDRHGEILTDSRPAFDVLLVPQDVEELDTTLERLSRLAGEPLEEVRERVGRPRGRARFQSQIVAGDLDRDALARIESRLWALPGVRSQVSPVREYRYGQRAAHLLGWLGEVSASELESRAFQSYRRGDSVGKEGIERLLDRELRGRDGGENLLVDAYGRELQRLDQIAPQPGNNVVLTLDNRLQAAAEAAFDKTGRNGAVVAVDPRSGEILVLMSRPAFDPNAFASRLDADAWSRLVDDPGKPLHNRALLGQYPPGSTFKVVTALAGLEKGIAQGFYTNCAGSYRLGRRRYRCWKRGGHGPVGLQKAIVQSCDVFFYQLGEALGVDTIAYYARALGAGRPTGIGLGREAGGLVPTKAWKERRFGEPWIKGETLSIAIGQGFNLWTPIQLAMAYAAIANGGLHYRPFVVKRITDPQGHVLRENEPELVEALPVSDASLAAVRRGLVGVVAEPRGTGYAMRRLPGDWTAAGKTGTAQVVALGKDPVKEDEVPIEHRDHAWFATYAPAEDPQIVVAVLVEHGGHGSSAAAPIAREVVSELIRMQLEQEAGPEGTDVAAAPAAAAGAPVGD